MNKKVSPLTAIVTGYNNFVNGAKKRVLSEEASLKVSVDRTKITVKIKEVNRRLNRLKKSLGRKLDE